MAVSASIESVEPKDGERVGWGPDLAHDATLPREALAPARSP